MGDERTGGRQTGVHAITETAPLDEAARAAMGVARLRTRALSLLVYHRDGIEAVPLPPNEAVIIGRDGPVTHPVADGSLSRMHARFTRIEGKVLVEDLESTNGTWVGGKPVARAELNAGDEVLLGGVAVCVHAPASGERDLHGAEPHERFLPRLEEEVERARFLRGRFALLMVHSTRGESSPRSRWYPGLRRCLRTIDRVGLYSADTVEILAPEISADEAARIAAEIANSGEGRDAPLRVGVVTFPEGAKNAHQLLDVCRGALHRATAEAPVATAPADIFSVEVQASAGRREAALVVESAAMREVFDQVDRIAHAKITVLVQGETGTGKEVVARAVHTRGARCHGPLVYLNCGAVPESLVETTLFGHERGAYTGASQRQKGVFEAAHGGTLILDEIGDMPLSAQVALLRVLEDGRVRRVGAVDEVHVDVRVIAATHRDLEAMCEAERFRHDLLYRLGVAVIALPPLRERAAEIEPLARGFLRRAAEDHGARAVGFTPDAMAALHAYRWPGNIRELRNVVERAALIARAEFVDLIDLPPKLQTAHVGAPSEQASLRGAAAPGAEPSALPGTSLDLREQVKEFERNLLLEALRASGDNLPEAARRLGIPQRTLRYRLNAVGVKKLSYGEGS